MVNGKLLLNEFAMMQLMFWTTFVFAEDIFCYLKVGYTRHWNSNYPFKQ